MKIFTTSMDIERGPSTPFITVTVELQEPGKYIKIIHISINSKYN